MNYMIHWSFFSQFAHLAKHSYGRSSSLKPVALLSIAVVLASITGCGGAASRPKTYPVTGKVTYKGKAISGATVSFRKKDAPRTATGITKEDGTFVLSTFATNDGALEGEHMVVIFKVNASTLPASTSQMTPDDYLKKMQNTKSTQPPGAGAGNDELPAKYGKPETSGLTRTVVAGETNTFDFDLVD